MDRLKIQGTLDFFFTSGEQDIFWDLCLKTIEIVG
jgi:hypothetical protein